MSTNTAPDGEPVREGYGVPLDEDIPTRLTRGVVDGFTEASEAFSHEIEGTSRFPDLMGRSVAGVIRANARLLDELATVVRQTSDVLSVRSRTVANDEIDYERLADLVAQRLNSLDVGRATAESRGYSGSERTKAERSGTKSDAFSGYSTGKSEPAASQRGKSSRSSSRSGGRRR